MDIGNQANRSSLPYLTLPSDIGHNTGNYLPVSTFSETLDHLSDLWPDQACERGRITGFFNRGVLPRSRIFLVLMEIIPSFMSFFPSSPRAS